MTPNKSGPAAINDEADVRSTERGPYTASAPKSQVSAYTIQYVTSGLGPTYLLRPPRHSDDCARSVGGCLCTPRVYVATFADKVIVGIENLPWGWLDATRHFLNSASPSILKYAELLRDKLRAAAFAEETRRARHKALRQAERDSYQ